MSIDYHRKITVSNTPTAAYQSLTTGFDKWWTNRCNQISAAGDKVTFRFGPTYWTMRVNDLVLDQYIELECVDAHHVHEGLPLPRRRHTAPAPPSVSIDAR